MLFNSYVFLFYFLPIAIAGYYGLARFFGSNAARVWLVLASFLFYGWWNPVSIFPLAVSIAFNYILSLWILDSLKRPELQRLLLTVGISLNLLALVYYKYLFALLGVAHATGLLAIDLGNVVLPLGISFFTFTQIGYLVDCQQELVRERGLVNYVVFVTFFPHLIAGPILHHREIMPQFADDSTYKINFSKIASGFTLFVFGLAKKVILADSIASWAETGFSHPAQLGVLGSWTTIFAYSMQLYFDFSGYSDMAVGLGAMFGVHLPLNFNSPYKSTSIIDFWQRFHMTLTRYLTLLLYNPLSLWVTRRRRVKGLSTNRRAAETPSGFLSLIAFPTITTMTLAGIWHGAGLQFVLFGVLHGFYLTINHAYRVFGPKAPKTAVYPIRAVVSHLWRVVVTYMAVVFAELVFRSEDVPSAFTLVGGAFGSRGTELPFVMSAKSTFNHLGPISDALRNSGLFVSGKEDVYAAISQPILINITLLAGLAAIVWGAPNVNQILGDWSPALQKVAPVRWKFMLWKPTLVWAAAVAILFYYALIRLDHPGRFLYFQF